MKPPRIATLLPTITFLFMTCGLGQDKTPVPKPKRLQALEVQSTTLNPDLLRNQLRLVQVNQEFVPGMLEHDVEMNLKSFLKENGYMQADVTWEELPYPDGAVQVRIKVTEGMQYRLSKLEFKDVKAFSLDEITEQFPLRPGDVLNFGVIKKGLEKVKRMYAEKGYINWSYLPELNFNLQTQTMDLTFTFVEDIPYRIGFIGFVGCGEQAEEDRLRDVLRLRPGEVFKPSDLRASLAALNQLGVYQSIEEGDSDVIPVEGKPGWLSVIFRLKPKS